MRIYSGCCDKCVSRTILNSNPQHPSRPKFSQRLINDASSCVLCLPSFVVLSTFIHRHPFTSCSSNSDTLLFVRHPHQSAPHPFIILPCLSSVGPCVTASLLRALSFSSVRVPLSNVHLSIVCLSWPFPNIMCQLFNLSGTKSK